MKRIKLPVSVLLLCLASTGIDAAEQSVTVKRLQEMAIHPERDAPAGVLSLNESRIAAEVSARILELPAQVGQVVDKGAVVARLDPRDAQLAVERAEAEQAAARARLELARNQLRRAQDLKNLSFISSEALNQRETEVAVQEAQARLVAANLNDARRALEKTVIRAPFRAVVLARQGQVGELATPGAPLMTLLDADRIEISAQVQQRDAASLRAAKEVSFVSLAGRHPLRLLRVSPAVNREARSMEARLAFTGPGAPPGAEGRIVWRDSSPHLPAEFVTRRDGRLGVFVANSEKARFVPLPDAQEGRPAAIDLPPDTPVIVAGRHSLTDGQAIAIARP